MAMEVLHNCCNMCTLDLTDVQALSLEAVVLVHMHTNQITCAHVITITWNKP